MTASDTPKKQPQSAAIIVAGGLGARFSVGNDVPKQRRFLAGLPVYIWSLAQVLKHEAIAKVVLVSHKSIIDELTEEIDSYINLPREIVGLTLSLSDA